MVKFEYETKDCSRCGGSGRYSFNMMDGDKCYGCNGSGKQLTPAAKKTMKAVKEWQAKNFTVAVSSLEPGQVVIYNGARRTVVKVETELGYGGGKSKWGVEGTPSFVEVWQLGRTTLTTKKMSMLMAAHAPVVALPVNYGELLVEFLEGRKGVRRVS